MSDTGSHIGHPERSRIGNPEREHARRVLDAAVEQGYFDVKEYRRRIEALAHAVWESDLAPLLGDLDRVEAMLAGQHHPAAVTPTYPQYDEDTGLPWEESRARFRDGPVERWQIEFKDNMADRITGGVTAFWAIVGVVVFLLIVCVLASLVGYND